MVFNNDVSTMAPYTMTDLWCIVGWIIVILIGIGIAIGFNYFRKPKVKPEVAICVKCMFCVQITGIMSKGKETNYRCRLPDDMVHTDFITGKVEYPKYSCWDRNKNGVCAHYEKRWLK